MSLALLAQRVCEILQHLELLLERQRLDFTNDVCSNHGGRFARSGKGVKDWVEHAIEAAGAKLNDLIQISQAHSP